MAYLRCESCGAKALVAASRCPRCANEFRLIDGRGERVRLSQCRGCSIMHRHGAECHWCPPRAARSWRSSTMIQSAAATVLFAVIGASTWTYGSHVQDFVSHRIEAGRNAIAERSVRGSIRIAAASPAAAAPVSAASPSVSGPDSVALVLASTPTDSTRWEPAVARTWVNIRNDAGRSGDVVGVIKPASRAMLGATGRAGWRQVRSGDTTGWADSRLFEADSLASRG